MQIALIGLGRMGLNMTKRLFKSGHNVVAYDLSKNALKAAADHGATTVNDIAQLKDLLERPRTAWIMVPHGAAVDKVLHELEAVFEPGDIIIDGGNSHFLDSIKRHEVLRSQGIHFLDVGVSGGIFGLERGYCLMIGGDKMAFNHVEPIFKSLAPGVLSASPTKSRKSPNSSAHEGYYHCGKSGSGHYVKMVHNAIEYSMMQSYAEGLELLKNAHSEKLDIDQRLSFDVREICELWRRGSVINSWLLDLLSDALHKDPELKDFSGSVPDSGEGRWALIEAIKQGVPSSNLANSLFTRFRSRMDSPFAERTLSALRKEFGGHSESIDGLKS